MEELLTLFVIYVLFLSLSIISGFASYLISPEHYRLVTGSLLILSSLSVLTIFINSFVFSRTKGGE